MIFVMSLIAWNLAFLITLYSCGWLDEVRLMGADALATASIGHLGQDMSQLATDAHQKT
jgi:hypothetical protein